MTPTTPRIGDRIEARRTELGLSRAALAREINARGESCADAKSVKRWEANAVTPQAETALHIADALGVDLRWLLTGESEAA